MRKPFVTEAAPITTTLTPEIERTEHDHYLPVRYLREQATKAAQERTEVWRTSDGTQLAMQPRLDDSGNLQIRVSDPNVEVAPRTPKPWEVVITVEAKTPAVRAYYLADGKTQRSLRGARDENGVLTWDKAVMEWRTSLDRQSGNQQTYLVPKLPEMDDNAREDFNRLRGMVNEISDRCTEQMVISTRVGLQELIATEPFESE